MSIDFEVPAEAKAIRAKVRKWVQDDLHGFAALYQRARQAGRAIMPGQLRYTGRMSQPSFGAGHVALDDCIACRDCSHRTRFEC